MIRNTFHSHLPRVFSQKHTNYEKLGCTAQWADHLTSAGFALQCCFCSASADVMMGHVYGTVFLAVLVGCASCAMKLCVRENGEGWLVAWGLCECTLIRSSAVWLLPFTIL